MNEYETIFVVRPDVAETQANQLLEKVNGIIERHKGVVLQQKNWGKKELAYRVEKQRHGIYFYYNYAGDNTVVGDVERFLRINESAMKFLTVKLADDVDVDKRKNEIAEKAAAGVSEVPKLETASEPIVRKRDDDRWEDDND